jgi:hypothetical protein
MTKHFNLLRYKELLQLEESGKYSLLDETFLELLTYQASIGCQISYNQKENYFSLIEKYLSRVMTPSEFRLKFSEIEKQDSRTADIILEDFQELEVFMLANDLKEFFDLKSEISTLCFGYYEVWDGTIEPMSESEFYNLVNNSYLQFQKAFPVLSSQNLTYENLIYRLFKILTLSIGLGILLNLMRLLRIRNIDEF